MKTIFTVTGPSCVGKTTLVRMLQNSSEFTEIVSTTSRKPRDRELNGVDYHFKTAKRCVEIEDEGGFAEHIQFNGNHYGIERDSILLAFATGRTPLVIVEPNGLAQLKRSYDCFAIYVDGVIEAIYTRFLTRFKENTEANPEYEAKRLVSIQNEHKNWWQDNTYNHIIPNFDRSNEKLIVNTLVTKARLLRKDND